ncbi:MICOS complex subunit MIC13 homolog QIL1-like [Euwallacea fornicatus]|uniref:MICOS complex subunit MIC13 homolog QIL1-like n=1 Tax=Euwallacea fornicatus TaxID=995702 RepID=UPI00338F650B
MGIITFAIKAGLAGTAVYYVRNQGIWNTSEEAIEASKRVKTAVDPYLNDLLRQIPFELPNVPESENMCQLTKEYWNVGVKTTFRFLVQLPSCSRALMRKGADFLLENPEIRKFVDSFSSAPKSPKAIAN